MRAGDGGARMSTDATSYDGEGYTRGRHAVATVPRVSKTAEETTGVRHFALDTQKFLEFSSRMDKIVTFRQ